MLLKYSPEESTFILTRTARIGSIFYMEAAAYDYYMGYDQPDEEEDDFDYAALALDVCDLPEEAGTEAAETLALLMKAGCRSAETAAYVSIFEEVA